MVKFTGCLGVLLVCSVGIAAAQGVPTLPVSPDTVASLMAKARGLAATTNGALAQQKDPPTNGAGSTLNGVGNVPLGRNTFHAGVGEQLSAPADRRVCLRGRGNQVQRL
jgi:hypothetical protein